MRYSEPLFLRVPNPHTRAASPTGKNTCNAHYPQRRRRDATAHLEMNVFNSYPSSSRARNNQKGFRLEVKSCMFSVIHQIKMPQPHILHMCYIVYNGMM